VFAEFVFATGIENSSPVIAEGVRVDEMEKCGHYRRWREDLELTRQSGIRHLRWGPALYRTFPAPGRYDWTWVDDVLDEMKRLDIQPILDLCHFGVPDWLGNFQNPDFPDYFAEYAQAFACRYPHIAAWTPVNEAYITALFSARYGWWNERLASDAAFVRATLNLARATLLAQRAIHKRIPTAFFVQSESCEYFHADAPDAWEQARLRNELRFLPLDLIYGRPLSQTVLDYLRAGGMTEADYAFFQANVRPARCVLGIDYYVTNEHTLQPDGRCRPAGDVLGFYALAREYYHRYLVPLMHTETNLSESQGASSWLKKQWQTLLRLRQDGIPVLGFTWYSLTDQMDWDTALREDARRVNPVGLFDLNRHIRPVGLVYQQLIRDWQGFLNSQPLSPHLDQSLRAA
jgi:beta-glucosidase